MSRTTARFLSGVKQRITVVSNQALLTDAQILELASDILETDITKILIASKQNYLVGPPIDIALVAEQDAYDLPYRSVAGGLREIKYLLSDNSWLRNLPIIDIEDLGNWSENANGSGPQGFYFRGDQVVIVPTPGSGEGYLRMWYYAMPSKLCQTSEAALITAIASNVVTVSAVPTGWVAGTIVDFIKAKSISTTLDIDEAITNISGTQITFAEVPSRLAVGDWLAPQGFTPILPIPDALNRYFEGLTGASILYAISDYEGSKALDEEVRKDEKDVQSLIEPRIDGEIEKIINNSGLLRQRSWRYMGSYGG